MYQAGGAITILLEYRQLLTCSNSQTGLLPFLDIPLTEPRELSIIGLSRQINNLTMRNCETNRHRCF